MLMLFLGIQLQAQQCNYSISGVVRDFHDGDALVNSTLSVNGFEIYALSDFDGNYKLEGLCAGTYTITITHPECEVAEFTVEVAGDVKRDFKLEHHTEELNSVTVKGQNLTKGSASSAAQLLQTDDLENYSNASLGDALREIPGVSSLNTGSTVVKPVIQGLHSSRVLIINNGTRMEDQEWGVEHAPNLDLNTAANITVVKGASALRYGGDAVGGVILTQSPKAHAKDTLYGKTILSGASNGRGYGVTSTLMKAYESGFYIQGQGTRKRSGDRESPDYVLSNTGVSENDFSVGIGLDKFTYGFDAYYSMYDAEIGILRASHIGNVSDLVRAINSGEPFFIRDFTYDINAPKQDVRHHLAKLSMFKRFEKAGKLTLDYSFQQNNRKEFDIRRGRNDPSLDLKLTTHTLQSNFAYDARSDFKADFGVEASYQENFPNPETDIRRLIPDYEMYTFGTYATASYDLTEKIKLDGGFRYDFSEIDAQKFYRNSSWEDRGYDVDFADIIVEQFDNQLLVNPVFDYHNFSGTLGGRYQFANNWDLKLNFSSASRAPNPAELFSDGLHHSAAIIELGDLRNKQEQSFKTSLELNGQSGGFTFGVNPFYNRINDFIILEPIGVQYTNRGAFPVHEYRQVDARLYGVDLQAAYYFNDKFDIKTSFAYVNGQDLDRDRPLIDMPAPNVNTVLSFRKAEWNNLNVSLRNQSVFKQTRFPNNDFQVNYINESGSEVTETVKISESPAAYSLFHIASSAEFKVLNQSTLTLGLYVDNVLNTAYRDYLNRQRYFADDLGRNFRIQIKLNY
ncbi:iron complex outermembrane receptor protein [Leeuwenhoekiella aestuarii]|uniref:Iron complex outermembrane receptor protein n=2 Tax=Leeuwenhoekiella aestuarii TaxID=2249426 RepID=A0A4Q0NV07_9FLAO|nr:iron complex outermembrane receptor protein [Leeuwenhoekiella aestuarii]RXG17535.1 iron complex outermembrane receptor protein [Leeuwenhoekiella aestuarii]